MEHDPRPALPRYRVPQIIQSVDGDRIDVHVLEHPVPGHEDRRPAVLQALDQLRTVDRVREAADEVVMLELGEVAHLFTLLAVVHAADDELLHGDGSRLEVERGKDVLPGVVRF